MQGNAAGLNFFYEPLRVNAYFLRQRIAVTACTTNGKSSETFSPLFGHLRRTGNSSCLLGKSRKGIHAVFPILWIAYDAVL